MEDIGDLEEETGDIREKDTRDIGEEETGNRAKEEQVEEEEVEDKKKVVEKGKDSAIGALYYRLVDLADIVHYLDQEADMEQLKREGTMQPVEGALRRYLREVVKAYGRYTGLRNY